MSVPIHNAAGEVVGILAGITTLDQPNFLDRIAAHKFGTSGGYVLVDTTSRTIITATDSKRVMEALPPPGVNAVLDRHVAGGEGVDLAVNPRGVETLSATKHLRGAAWYAVANLPTVEAFAAIGKLEQYILTWGALVIGVAMLVVWWNLRRTLSPLLRTAAILDKATLTGQSLPALPVDRPDEFGVVTLAFNRMLAHLQQKEREVERLALFDQLTQLPNRRLFLDRLSQAMTQSARHGSYAALLFLDMDKFKDLNDNHGHVAGDALLCEVAHRLRSIVRATDTVARLGGDEFVAILNGLPANETEAMDEAKTIAETIRASLAETYLLQVSDAKPDGQEVHFGSSASIGVCVFLGGRIAQTTIIQVADEAMYAAKRSGRNTVHIRLAEPAKA